MLTTWLLRHLQITLALWPWNRDENHFLESVTSNRETFRGHVYQLCIFYPYLMNRYSLHFLTFLSWWTCQTSEDVSSFGVRVMIVGVNILNYFKGFFEMHRTRPPLNVPFLQEHVFPAHLRNYAITNLNNLFWLVVHNTDFVEQKIPEEKTLANVDRVRINSNTQSLVFNIWLSWISNSVFRNHHEFSLLSIESFCDWKLQCSKSFFYSFTSENSVVKSRQKEMFWATKNMVAFLPPWFFFWRHA